MPEIANLELEEFIVQLTQQCSVQNRDRWLKMMHFGLESLLKNPGFLMELIVLRAQSEYAASQDEFELGPNPKNHSIGETAKFLMQELGVSLAIADPSN